MKINLPKNIVKTKAEEQVLERLSQTTPLYPDSETLISEIKMNPELRSHIFFSKATKNAIIGMERIEMILDREKFGLKGNESNRISRLLLVSNDGSERFYRQLEFLLKNHGDRLLICRLDIDSEEFGKVLSENKKKIKALLITHKEYVSNVLMKLK